MNARSRLRRLGATLSAPFDMRDCFFFGGLGLAAWGGSMLSVPWTLILVGVVLAGKAHGPIVIRETPR
jgi:hypothetical protein